MRAGLLVILTTLTLASCGGSQVDDAIGRYCNYGATSKAQYDGCVEHVSYDEIARRYDRIKPGSPEADRSAAVYAVECDGSPGEYSGADAMPYCALAP